MNTSGRHFLQIPGPTNVPDRILRALQQPTIDHRGPEFKEEGLDQVFARHRQLAEATRKAVQGWNLEMNALHSHEFSDSLTAVRMPEGHDADQFRKVVLENFNVSLGNGLGKIHGKVFRIGHLGDFNAPMLLGTLGAIEMGLELAGVPFKPEGVRAAMDELVKN